MRSRLVVTAILMLGSVLSRTPTVQAQQKQPPARQKKSADDKNRQATLTGCVDQQEGRYVLIHDQTRNLIAHLEAEGFPTEGFAKHVGHKVNVRGTSSSNAAEGPVFKVRSVEAVSDGCGPQQ
jgi:hypothetical protein